MGGVAFPQCGARGLCERPITGINRRIVPLGAKKAEMSRGFIERVVVPNRRVLQSARKRLATVQGPPARSTRDETTKLWLAGAERSTRKSMARGSRHTSRGLPSTILGYLDSAG